jgi:Icc protein
MTPRLLHLSDLHLNATGKPGYGIDADLSLRLVLDSCAHLDDLSAVVVTGDLADDGSPAAYERARDTLLAFAVERDAHLALCVGNHDDRAAFSAVLGNGHFERAGRPGPDPRSVADRICAVSVTDGLKIITLDTLVPGRWYGLIGEAQLAWLETALADEPHLPAVIALHHPPIDLGVEIQQRVGLQDRRRLAAVLSGSSAAVVLCGHFHQQIAGRVGPIPTWVTPGVFCRIDHLSGPKGTERATAGGGASLIDLTEPAAPLFATITARDPAAGQLAYEVTQAEIESDLTEFGMPQAATAPG